MVYLGRFKSYCLAVAACFLSLPALAFAEPQASAPAATSLPVAVAGKVSSGVNPDYALPDYALFENSRSESSSSGAANPASFPLPR